MHTKSDNIEIMVRIETDDIIEELRDSLLQNYQKGLEEWMTGSEFVRDSVHLLYYHLHRISLKRGESYVDSPKWLKDKRATTNPKNKKDSKCFKYAITVALNHQRIGNNPQRILRIEPFMGQYEWKNIDFPAALKDWKKFEQDNQTIALNILFVPYNTKQISRAYISKYNYKCYNQVILSMITDGKKWHYLSLKSFPTFVDKKKKWFNLGRKSLSALFRGITSTHDGDFYCLNCFHSYSTEKKTGKTWKRM